MRLTTSTIALILAAMPAAAQRDYGRPVDSPETRAMRALRGSAACAVDTAPASARKVLESDVASLEEAKRVKSLIAVARKCYPQTWPDFPPSLVRGALAERLYLSSNQSRGPGATPAAPPASFGVVALGTRGTADQETAWTLAAVANCVVFADARAAHELLLVPAAVDEETRRFDTLRPALDKCLAADQAKVLKAATFRGYLADALYRRTRGTS